MSQKVPILSTAGAIPIRNEKGEVTMEKVKVQRYVTGKRPDYAPEDSSDEEDDNEMGFLRRKATTTMHFPVVDSFTEPEKLDRRLRRLQERRTMEDDDEEEEVDRVTRHRQLHEPEILGHSDDEEEEGEERSGEDESSEEEEELDDEEIEKRRALLRQKAREHREKQEEELLDKEEEEKEEGSAEESSEYEEYTDSEEEETGPRLKPIFVRKKDRITIQQKEEEQRKQQEQEQDAHHLAERRRVETLKIVETEARREHDEQSQRDTVEVVDTDEDNDEEEYEAWKVRELKRIKRDREERDTLEKEKFEHDRMHNMTEEERRLELKHAPKVIVNKAEKGKYKFLQKYYHRGAFFLDKDDEVFKRDFSSATLEDHFDKTILPKVMQVKNFGRSGRTKYTHLVDQDTTQFESPWSDNVTGSRLAGRTASSKHSFERPTAKRNPQN